MKISIMETGKTEKDSAVMDQVVDVNLERLGEVVCNNLWSPSVFKIDQDGQMRRRTDSFKSSDVVAIDIDEGLSIAAAIERLDAEGFGYLIGTTRHHQKEKNGKPACDRYRIVLMLEHVVESGEQYKSLLRSLREELFPELDKSCIDSARFFYPCVDIVIWKQGKQVPVTKSQTQTNVMVAKTEPVPALQLRTKKPLRDTTNSFIAHGAPAGQWHKAFVAASYDLKASGYTYEEAERLLQKAALYFQGELDESDLYHLRDVFINRGTESKDKLSRQIRGITDNMPAEAIFNEYRKQLCVGYEKKGSVITTTIDGKTEKFTPSEFENRLLVDLNSSRVKSLDKDLYRRCIALWMDEQEELYLEKIREEVAFDAGASKSEGGLFIGLLCGESNPNHKLDLAVLNHFIWQVKRKLYDLPVDHHMMPVVVGPQGVGKSEAIKKLVAPIAELVGTPPDVPYLTDPRNSAFLFRYYVLWFDEMARAKNTDVNKLKNLISSLTVEYRPLYSNSIDIHPNTATFLGCSNNGIAETINDTTGVRRFWEIRAREKDDRWDEVSSSVWEQINRVDYLAMWKSVNERAPSPILPYLKDIKAYQEDELRNKDSVELYLEETGLEKMSPESSESDWETCDEVYRDYKRFCESAGLQPMNKPVMGKRLKALGVKTNKSKNKRKYALRLSGPKYPF